MGQLQFITAIPLNVRQGSGCYVGTSTLIASLKRRGIEVGLTTPTVELPVFTAKRILFNESMRWRRFAAAATVGTDADGYALSRRPGSPPHIACIKGVLADALPYEQGSTYVSMALQARLEAANARRADLVITISEYCAKRIEAFYGVRGAVVVPELIDLGSWQKRFGRNPSTPDSARFTVLCVCRFYPRKRVDLLLHAAAQLRQTIPELQIRIVGDGPEGPRLRQLRSDLALEGIVHWLGDLSLSALSEEYQRADIFCLPSMQEGFGIVFLEAMAAGKPIVAAKAAAVPEVVRHGVLVEPGSSEALAEGILRLHRDRVLMNHLGQAGLNHVRSFDSDLVAGLFLSKIAPVVPGLERLTSGARRAEG